MCGDHMGHRHSSRLQKPWAWLPQHHNVTMAQCTHTHTHTHTHKHIHTHTQTHNTTTQQHTHTHTQHTTPHPHTHISTQPLSRCLCGDVSTSSVLSPKVFCRAPSNTGQLFTPYQSRSVFLSGHPAVSVVAIHWL